MFIRSGFTVVGLILPIAAASAQTAESIQRPIPPKAHERASDPYVPPVDAGVTEPASYPRGGPTPGVQVNTNSNGNNILGDAANEPSIGIDPTRPWRIAVGWRQFDNVASNFRQAGWAYSRDSGRTWTFPGRLTPGIFRSDPVLAADSTGVFYYSSLKQTFDVDFFKSNDGGRTWGSPIPAFGGDKQWFTIDTTGGIGNGNLYMCWSQYAGCCGTNVFTRSINAAATWSTPQALPRGHVFGTLDVGPNGDLFIVGSNANAYGIILSKSTNADDPAQPVTIPTTTDVNLGGDLSFGDPNLNPAGLLGQVIVATDRSGGPMNGYVYVLASVVPQSGTDPLDVRFARSIDGGVSFQPSIRVNADPTSTNAYQWFGTMSVAPNGRIDVVWNDTRHASNPSLPNSTELYYRYSTNGGTTWSAEQVLAPPWNPHLGFPNQNKIGDYYDMRSDNVGASLIYAATYNGEQDVWFLRIGDYDCNGNGVGDSAEIAGGTSMDINGNGNPDECECIGDMNGDFVVDLNDLTTFLAAFGSCTGQPNFNARADIDHDGCVTLSDLSAFLSSFGRTC